MLTLTPIKLLILQIAAHLSFIPMIMYGEWYHWAIAFFTYFVTGCFGMTMTFHRLLSHKSWNAPKWFEIFGTLAGTYGLTGSSIGWVAVHREHHHYTDQERDPHSPKHKGFVRVLDIDPTFSVSYDQEVWSFILTMHSVHVGKKKAWQSEGITQGKLIPRDTRPHTLSQF